MDKKQKQDLQMVYDYRESVDNKERTKILEYFYTEYETLLLYNNKFRNNEEKEILIIETIVKMLNTYDETRGTLVRTYLKLLFFYKTQSRDFISYENYTDQEYYENIPNETDEYEKIAQNELLEQIIEYISEQEYGDIFLMHLNGENLHSISSKTNVSHGTIHNRIKQLRSQIKEKFDYF